MVAMTRGPGAAGRSGSRCCWASEVAFHVGKPASGLSCTGHLPGSVGFAGCEVESIGDGRGGRYELLFDEEEAAFEGDDDEDDYDEGHYGESGEDEDVEAKDAKDGEHKDDEDWKTKTERRRTKPSKSNAAVRSAALVQTCGTRGVGKLGGVQMWRRCLSRDDLAAAFAFGLERLRQYDSSKLPSEINGIVTFQDDRRRQQRTASPPAPPQKSSTSSSTTLALAADTTTPPAAAAAAAAAAALVRPLPPQQRVRACRVELLLVEQRGASLLHPFITLLARTNTDDAGRFHLTLGDSGSGRGGGGVTVKGAGSFANFVAENGIPNQIAAKWKKAINAIRAGLRFAGMKRWGAGGGSGLGGALKLLDAPVLGDGASAQGESTSLGDRHDDGSSSSSSSSSSSHAKAVTAAMNRDHGFSSLSVGLQELQLSFTKPGFDPLVTPLPTPSKPVAAAVRQDEDDGDRNGDDETKEKVKMEEEKEKPEENEKEKDHVDVSVNINKEGVFGVVTDSLNGAPLSEVAVSIVRVVTRKTRQHGRYIATSFPTS